MIFSIKCQEGLQRFFYIEAPKGTERCKCPRCGKMHKTSPTQLPFVPSVNVPTPFKKHYSWIHGKKLSSWSDYHKANRENDLIDTGQKPHEKQRWQGEKAFSYQGKKRAE